MNFCGQGFSALVARGFSAPAGFYLPLHIATRYAEPLPGEAHDVVRFNGKMSRIYNDTGETSHINQTNPTNLLGLIMPLTS